MKVAHTVVVTPHRAGLYETARDLIAAERRLGVDARIIDPVNDVITTDRDVPVVHRSWADECQIIINHSGLSKELNQTHLPIIHVLHGRPAASFILEQSGKIPIYTYLKQIRQDPRFKSFVTFWPEFIPYWSLLLPREKIHSIPAPVDLQRWTPDGPNGYQFNGHKAKINIVLADMWRDDRTPYHVIHAFALFASQVPGAKLHIYAQPQKGNAWTILKSALEETGALGEVVGIVKGLDNVYRAADVAITPQRMATRSVREPLACGCNVVMAPNANHYTPYQADPEDLELYADQITRAVYGQSPNRKKAEMFFDPIQAAQQFVELMKEAIADGIQ